MNPKLRILLIDDNPDDRTLTRRELQQAFPEVQVQEIRGQSDYEQALQRGNFDLIITDYRLGWNDGLNILQTAKALYPDRPVIMFTNTGNEEIAVEAMKSGLDDYIIKSPHRYMRVPIAVRAVFDRAEARSQIAHLERRYYTLLDRLHIGAFRADSQGQLLECNPFYLTLLGIESIDQARSLLPFNVQEYYAQLRHQPHLQMLEEEVQVQRPDGRLIWVLVNMVLSPSEVEPVIDVLLKDITDRKQTELEIQRLNEQLEERVRSRTTELEAANQDLVDFASSVSHDLREPMRIIQGLALAILQDRSNQLDAFTLDYIQRIVNNTQQADTLIQDLLTYSQISRVDLPHQPVNLSALLNAILTQLEPEFQQQLAQITIEEPLPIVIGNYPMLTQVLTNLLTNAMKFVVPDEPIRVRIWAERRSHSSARTIAQPEHLQHAEGQDDNQPDMNQPDMNQSDTNQLDHEREHDRGDGGTSSSPRFSFDPPSSIVRLWVEDNGIGIPLQDQQRIFHVFTRLHSSEEYPGTGMGLAIVRKSIERMGGQVGVESQPGRGSRFWIELPEFLVVT